MILLRIVVCLLGVSLVAVTLFSAIKTFVLPRSAPDPLVRAVFQIVRRLLRLIIKPGSSYDRRDRIMAYFSPFGLMALLPTWYTLVMSGYTAIYWAVTGDSLYEALRLSGSSLLTLGFANGQGLPALVLTFSEATIGLLLVALLISYLPTMYAAFSRREAAVNMLEVRAGQPPSVAEMLLRYSRIHGLERLSDVWRAWELWFVDIDESHTSLPALVFFRSPQSEHSWVTAAGAVLDTASMTLSALDIPGDPQANLTIRAGYLALRHIADYFRFTYDPDPRPTDPISIRREEFEAVLDQLQAEGIPLKPDRDQAWRDFAGWRVNYDRVLLVLAGLVDVPESPWVGDRAIHRRTAPWYRSRE